MNNSRRGAQSEGIGEEVMEHSPQLDTTISKIFQETKDNLRILRVSSLSSATGLMRGIVLKKKKSTQERTEMLELI